MKKKKTAKAVTLLTRIEDLLSDAVDQLSAIEKSVEKSVRELLVSAAASVAKAKEFVSLVPSGAVRRVVKPRRVVARKRTTVRIKRPATTHA